MAEPITVSSDTLEIDGADSWRMPDFLELRSFIRGCPKTELGGECETECVLMACEQLEGPGQEGRYYDSTFDGDDSWYWSSSSAFDGSMDGDYPTPAIVLFNNGSYTVTNSLKDNLGPVRCVRTGR